MLYPTELRAHNATLLYPKTRRLSTAKQPARSDGAKPLKHLVAGLGSGRGIHMARSGDSSKKSPIRKADRSTPWSVVVHNDPISLMSYVTFVFQRVFGYPRLRAERHMKEIQDRGRSIVWMGDREKAEFYVQQLHAYQLLATLEKSAP
jgi:ATP-dependent Clp protease adaptor protein ClpS